MAEVRLVVDMNLAQCPQGMCPGDTCTRPICARPRSGDCPSGQAGPCLMPHEYPRPEFKFDEFVSAWRQSAETQEEAELERQVQKYVAEELGVPVEDVAGPEADEGLKREGWLQPDGRFWFGLGMAGVGGYLLWKFGKKGR